MQHKINLLSEEKSDSGWYAATDNLDTFRQDMLTVSVGQCSRFWKHYFSIKTPSGLYPERPTGNLEV